jgi:hypothetical protein
MKTSYRILVISLFFIFSVIPLSYSQDDINEKINKINGTVDKVTIIADGQEYVFEGDQAEQLFKKMKNKSSHSFVWNTSDDESMKKKVIILDADGENEMIEIESEDDNVFILKTDKDFDKIDCGMTKKVKVEIEDGNKKVTVTTKENGEEKTEVYEGKEADEYLEKMKSENDDLDIIIEKDSGKKVKKIIIETEKEEN